MSGANRGGVLFEKQGVMASSADALVLTFDGANLALGCASQKPSAAKANRRYDAHLLIEELP